MVRADPRRGRTRRPQLDLGPRAARRATLARVVHGCPATAPPPACNDSDAPRPEAWSAPGRRRRNVTGLEDPRPSTWSCRRGIAQTNGAEARRAGGLDPAIQSSARGKADPSCSCAVQAGTDAAMHARRSGSSGSNRPVDGRRDRGDDLRQASRRSSSSGRAYRSGSSTGPNLGEETRHARGHIHQIRVRVPPAVRGRASVPALSLLGASGAILCPRAIRGHIFTGIGGFLLPARASVPVA